MKVELERPLAEQLESSVSRSDILSAAVVASEFLKGLLQRPVDYQEDVLGKFGLTMLDKSDVGTHDGIVLALLCVTSMEVSKQTAPSRYTASERAGLMLGYLSDNYQADW